MHQALAMSLVTVALGITGHAQVNLIRNPSFEDGEQAPAGWSLSAEPGVWEQAGRTGGRCLSVEGVRPEQYNWWAQSSIPVEPFSTYRFSFYAKSSPGATGGCIVSGPDFCNADTDAGQQWERRSHVFITPRSAREMTVRLGHWHKLGKVYFDDVDVHPVTPVHRRLGAVTLGAGERISDGRYQFVGPFGQEGRNYSRCLEDFTAGFNTNRWVFGPGAHLVFRHDMAGVAQTAATVRVTISYHSQGHCVVEGSVDGRTWQLLGTASENTTAEFKLPAELLPAPAVLIRVRSPRTEEADSGAKPGAFQITGYSYTAELAQRLRDMTGDTQYLDVLATDPRLAVTVEGLGELLPGGDNRLRLRVRNNTDQGTAVRVEVAVGRAGATGAASGATATAIEAHAEEALEVPYAVHEAGPQTLDITVTGEGGVRFAARTEFAVADLYSTAYGHPLQAGEVCELWWCEGTYKVSRERPAPTGEPQPVRISAARNEFEPFQVVLRPKRDLAGVTVAASDLIAPNGAKVAADNLSICQVWYHHVEHPTDEAGCVGWWPDALPPVEEPLDLPGGRNQPLWVTVKVPKGTPAGDYQGTLDLRAEGWRAQVPVQLHVWDFTLPDESHVQSGFGLDPGNIFRYHNITQEEDKERVWDLYMQNFRDHRIAPYNFWRRGMAVEITGAAWEGGEIVEEAPAEGRRCLRIVDDSATVSVAASAARRLPVDPAARYVLTFAAKTAEPGQKYLVTFGSFDEGGKWISGHNLDVPFTGTGEWRRETLAFVPRDRSPDAKSLQLTLRPVLWTEDGKYTGTAWFDDMKLVKEGSDQNLLEDGGFEAGYEAMHVKVDFSAWDREADKYLDDYHFTAFALPVMGLGGGTFHSRYYGRMGTFKQGTPEYRRLMREYLGQVQDHLEQRGWLHKAYVYWFDEPEPKDYDFVREGMAELKLAGPKIRRMLTEEPVEPLFGSVDLWCPVLPNHNPEVCAERQRLGESIWWYVCTGPKAPWPGLFIDHNAVDMRVWLWMTWKWRVQGVLVWNTTWWTSSCAFPDSLQNPWEDPMGYVAGYGLPPGYVGYWGNGDGRFLYPPNKDVAHDTTPYVTGPVNSIRWEMLREGIEDYEYFWLLQQRLAGQPEAAERALLEVPTEIVAGQTQFTKDPQPMYRHREALARAIEALAARP